MSRPSPSEPNDGRAMASLVLGLLSFVTCGLTAIPAVAVGLSARSAIDRSGGSLRGAGLAAAGVATGIGGALTSLVGAMAFIAGLSFASQGTIAPRLLLGPPSGATALWTPAPSADGDDARTARVGAARVTTVDPAAKQTFRQQLEEETERAAESHRVVVLMTSAARCSVCREIDGSLSDARMQAALANVDLVRVDINDFARELHQAGMLEDTLPWFYKLDATLTPTDAISAGEWDENVPENMAPVLQAFFAGKLRTRRMPSTLGVSL